MAERSRRNPNTGDIVRPYRVPSPAVRGRCPSALRRPFGVLAHSVVTDLTCRTRSLATARTPRLGHPTKSAVLKLAASV
jgi:hypothetical protein